MVSTRGSGGCSEASKSPGGGWRARTWHTPLGSSHLRKPRRPGRGRHRECHHSGVLESITGRKTQLFVFIPRLTQTLVMRMKISQLLHRGSVLLENQPSWVGSGTETGVLTASLTNPPSPQSCRNKPETQPYMAHRPATQGRCHSSCLAGLGRGQVT